MITCVISCAPTQYPRQSHDPCLAFVSHFSYSTSAPLLDCCAVLCSLLWPLRASVCSGTYPKFTLPESPYRRRRQMRWNNFSSSTFILWRAGAHLSWTCYLLEKIPSSDVFDGWYIGRKVHLKSSSCKPTLALWVNEMSGLWREGPLLSWNTKQVDISNNSDEWALQVKF